MLALARSGAAEGSWLRAERQTGGRGRQGRAWVSPPGNFYGSTLVRLRPDDPLPATLALVAAVALEEVVRAYVASAVAGATIRIKWPNDLLLDGAKLSGVLLERADDAVVIGVGVNIAHHPTGLGRSATSLAAHGSAPDVADFAETLADAFARWVAVWRGEGIAPIRARWLERAHPVGTALSVHLPGEAKLEGLFAKLDCAGALLLRLADGTVRVIHAGDVFLI